MTVSDRMNSALSAVVRAGTVADMEGCAIRQITSAPHVRQAADVLAAAFADDPLMAAIWPDRSRRVAALPGYFETSLRYVHSSRGLVDVIEADGRFAGVAVWDAPGTDTGLRPTTALRLARQLGRRAVSGLRVRRILERHEPREPHWYLSNIGVAPQARCRGLAGALLNHRLAQVDRDGLPAYLVATTTRNARYYRRFGFTERAAFTLADRGDTLMRPMWRPTDALRSG